MNTVTKINLSNLKKCDQVWAEMPENEKGRLCLKCNYTIIDFRDLTDSEVAAIHLFSKNKVCGLYSKEQMKKPRRKTNKLNNWSSLYIGLFTFLTFNSFGQKKVQQIKTEQTENKYDTTNRITDVKNNKKRSITTDSIFIFGKLTDEANNPLSFAMVIIKETKTGVSSDLDGFYRLNITKPLDSLKTLTIRYSSIGFETKEIKIDSTLILKDKNKTIDVKLTPNVQYYEYAVRVKHPLLKRIWYKIKNTFRRKQ